MISCTLNNQKYSIDFVSGRALREMEPAAKMYGRIVALSNAALKGETSADAGELSIADAMDVMIRWFCVLFGNQFTPDDVLDYYPVDRLMHDIALALMSVQTQTTSIEGSITLNTELQEAYSGTTSMNSAVDGEFPTLPPGAVPYSWEGNVSRIEIQPNWRSL